MKLPHWLATLALSTLLVGPSCADDKPGTATSPTKDLLKAAVEAANNDEGAKAIGLAERALKGAPDDREALYLLGVLASVEAGEAKGAAEKAALFRKSAGALARLKSKHAPLTRAEADLADRAGLDEPRALALEGKAEPALAAILDLVAKGFESLDAIEDEPDLAAVRKLPRYAPGLARAIKAGVAGSLAKARPFPFDFTLKDVDGKAVALADYKGKVTIVDVWGTWCPPCRREIPVLVDLYKTYKPKGLEIVGINCNEEGSPDEVRKTIKDFAAAEKIEYKCVLNDDKTETKIPEFQGYPTTLFLDRSGKVRLAVVGSSPRARLEAIVTALLAEDFKP